MKKAIYGQNLRQNLDLTIVLTIVELTIYGLKLKITMIPLRQTFYLTIVFFKL